MDEAKLHEIMGKLVTDMGRAAMIANVILGKELDSHFQPSIVTTLQTQISRISIGYRISLVIRLWLTEASTWSVGFVPNECHSSTHAA
jgi:hypothetical protein